APEIVCPPRSIVTWLAPMSSPSVVEQWRSVVSLTFWVIVSPQERASALAGPPSAPTARTSDAPAAARAASGGRRALRRVVRANAGTGHLTCVRTAALLSWRSGSGVPVETVVVFASVVSVLGAWQTRMIVLVEPSPIAPSEQLSAAPEAGSGGVHAPWGESARTKLVPAGSGSLTTTSSASAGPRFRTRIT